MKHRLQVLLEDDEYRELKETAARERMTVAEWVRQALRLARRYRFNARSRHPVIFVDSNIPMYVVGRDHPNKLRSIELLETFIRTDEHLVTSTEVFQEILHRYTAISWLDAIGPAFDCLQNIADEVVTFGMSEVRRAKAIIAELPSIPARDALHVAVMEKIEVKRVLSFDHGFDACGWIERVS